MAQAENFVFNKPIRIIFTDSLLAAKPFRNEDGTMGAARYNIQGIIPADHPELPAFQAAILRVAQAGLPAHVNDAGVWTKEGLKLPLKSGAKLIAEAAAKAKAHNKNLPDRSYYEGGVFVLFAQKPEKSQKGQLLDPPKLRVLQNGQFVAYDDEQRPLAKPFFYNGVLASVSVQLKEYTGFGGGVTCYIDRVLSLNTGERINIGRSDEDTFGSADSFSEYVGRASSESVVPQAEAPSGW